MLCIIFIVGFRDRDTPDWLSTKRGVSCSKGWNPSQVQFDLRSRYGVKRRRRTWYEIVIGGVCCPRIVYLQKQRSLWETILVEVRVWRSSGSRGLAARIQIGVSNIPAMQRQCLGEQELGHFHTPDYANISFVRNTVHRLVDSVWRPIGGSSRCASIGSTTEWQNIEFKTSHGRIRIPEIDDVNRPLGNGRRTDASIGQRKSTTHTRELIIARNDQLAQAIQIPSENLARSQSSTRNIREMRLNVPRIGTIGTDFARNADRKSLSLRRTKNFRRFVHFTIVIVIVTISKRTIEIHPKSLCKIHWKQLGQRSVVDFRIIRSNTWERSNSVPLRMQHLDIPQITRYRGAWRLSRDHVS